MSRQAQLLRAHAELTAAILSGEAWESSYKDSPATFKRLVREEAALQASANEYLLGLSERVPRLVNWSEAGLKPLMASAVAPESDEIWTTERAVLNGLLSVHITELMVIGGNAGEYLYDRPIQITSLDDAILKAADKLTSGLVSDVTATTRRNIQRAIKRSIAQGDDLTAALARIRGLVASPVRAEMIAQTESVNAYQAGLDLFGEKTGVESWTWEALLGACKLCSPLNGKTLPAGEYFTLANGSEVLRPPGHVRCRCGRIANYPK